MALGAIPTKDFIPVSEYRALLKSGKVKPHQPKKKGKGDKAKAEMEMVLKLMGVKYESEYRFHPTRKWRFDWAIPEKRIGVEFEGIMSDKSRHTTVNGYTKDSEKYNAASKLGWVVLRYTVISYKKMTKDLIELFDSEK